MKIFLAVLLLLVCATTAHCETAVRDESGNITEYIYMNTSNPPGSSDGVYFSPSENRADFSVMNLTEKPIDFRSAEYYAIGKDGQLFKLTPDTDRLDKEDFICKPTEPFQIRCSYVTYVKELPNSWTKGQIRGFYITLRTGARINFESEDAHIKELIDV